ncbi:MFS transporter [Dulcicalothrix desertica PCC 7102]|uniref:MFS transporter n=1 Tax=Dulcicalothrix desertica PCC 7102 TaxID=232991 RepID=A0A3S1B5A8_9CYAN|nr:BCD family MFS transporter [Dulcicalothrix desertica]RUT05123.1 MFS transporter [Dulcicalothrix desertica PCC 7102]TWH43368.1 BCD family chlorophyll transporter-like MFS transporter [Dulcicalothrix desertica PCC 7102]
MASGNLSSSQSDAHSLPKVDILTMFRLGFFQMALGIMSVLTLGVLNRIMIDELKVPAFITALAIAMHQFVAPVRILFGQISDSKPFLGHHRTGYIWLGAALFTSSAFLAVQVVWQVGNSLEKGAWTSQTTMWVALLGLVFAIYGVALSASSTPFTALLVDISDEDNRSKIVGIVWSMLMVGIIIGAITSSGLLRQIQLNAPIEVIQTQVNRLFTIIPLVAFLLCLIGTVGVEKKYSRMSTRSTPSVREDKITLGHALTILTASRQTGIFFTFLLVMTISLFMQDAVMEPYGGEVFKMTIAETTKLNAFFGTGTLLGLGLTGILIAPRIGKKTTTKLGCIGVAICFILLIFAGVTANPKVLQLCLVLFGFASGVTTTGALSLMLDLTATEAAGTFVGAWGLAQAMSRALATVSGGAVLNFGKYLFNTPLMSYGLVFTVQAVGMIVALSFLARVNVSEFQRDAKGTMVSILEQELD